MTQHHLIPSAFIYSIPLLRLVSDKNFDSIVLISLYP